jgi:surfeit locus 1 family protein
MKPGFRFRPPWWGAALAVAGCAAGIALGNWQTDRAAQKRAAGAAVERLSLSGSFEPKHTVYLDNKLHRGAPGYEIVQPLRLKDGRQVLVKRGWIAMGATRERLPELRTPAGEVVLEGVRLARLAQALAPGAPGEEGRVWQNVTLERFSAWSGLKLEPYILEQHSSLDDGLVRDWPRADAGIEKHESYALQWYSLAALSLLLFFFLNLKIGKRKP